MAFERGGIFVFDPVFGFERGQQISGINSRALKEFFFIYSYNKLMKNVKVKTV